MKNRIQKEWLPLLLVAAPFAYLASVWTQLPDQVPLHWNLQGEVDRWGSKSEMWLIPVFTTVLIYILLTLAPLIDPKKRIAAMGAKYGQMKLALVGTMSVLALVIIHMTQESELASSTPVLFIIGLLFTLLGYFMKAIKPNYFIGIRTPWTLESPLVWEKTHRLGGWLFGLGGIVIAAMAVLADTKTTFKVTVFIGVGISLIAVVYSYVIYRKNS